MLSGTLVFEARSKASRWRKRKGPGWVQPRLRLVEETAETRHPDDGATVAPTSLAAVFGAVVFLNEVCVHPSKPLPAIAAMTL